MAVVTHQQALELAIDHHRAGRLVEAESIYRQLLALYPQNPDLWHLLGVLAHHCGRLDEGLALIQRAIAVNPGAFPYYNNLGLLLNRLARREEAVAAFHEAIRLQPDFVDPWHNLSISLCEMGRVAEAVEACRTALRIQPTHAGARLNLGLALALGGRYEEVEAHYRAVLAEDPADTRVAVNLANLLKDLSRIDEAIEIYRAALRQDPQDANGWNNLGSALKDSGEIEEAVECLRRSLRVNPNRPDIHSNLIFTSYFCPTIAPRELAEGLRAWNERHAHPLRAEWRSHENDPSIERKLRLGYVSPDFRDHVVGQTLLPCYEAHDRRQFEIICYSGVTVEDAITARYRALAAEWRSTAHLSDSELADQIRRDRIDILVDLTLHTAFNRLLTFARRPAPVQLSWLGYPGPVGVEAIDGHITDRFLEPEGADAEQRNDLPVYLPNAWTCYRPPESAPPLIEPPAMASGAVTFGSFNNLAKINQGVLQRWGQILARVENSRLLLIARGGGEKQVRDYFAACGIAPDRVEFVNYYLAPAEAGKADAPEYLRRYQRIDIALDPFPYNGMTTTCDALWMGVPVVALIGQTPMSRASYSLLSNVGLGELAAANAEEYVDLAAKLAADVPRMAELRATMRARLAASPLLDAAGLTRDLEGLYRTAWRRWCAQARQDGA